VDPKIPYVFLAGAHCHGSFGHFSLPFPGTPFVPLFLRFFHTARCPQLLFTCVRPRTSIWIAPPLFLHFRKFYAPRNFSQSVFFFFHPQRCHSSDFEDGPHFLTLPLLTVAADFCHWPSDQDLEWSRCVEAVPRCHFGFFW